MSNLEQKIDSFIKDKIENLIKEKEVNFKDILKTFEPLSKDDILIHLKELKKEKKCFEVNQKFLHIDNAIINEGIVHSNLNNFVWIEKEDKTNDYGVSTLIGDKPDLILINNKKDALLGEKAKFIEYEKDEKKYAYIFESKEIKPVKYIVAKNGKKITSLNNNSHINLRPFETAEFQEKLKEYKDNDILELEKKDNKIIINSFLGNISEKGIESKIVQSLYNLKNTLKMEEFNDSSIKSNKSLKDKHFITIDAVTTKDIDDAIYIEKKENGYDLYVAIADVSRYVTKNSQHDLHARNVSTTHYLTQNKIHMFDKNLSENICSLNVGEEKPAFVCKMQYNKDGKLLKYDFLEADIQVKTKIPYEDVDAVFSEKQLQNTFNYNNGSVSSIVEVPNYLKELLLNLNEFVDTVKKQQRDYWFLPNPDFKLNENGKIEKLYIEEEGNSVSQKIVENCMLQANISAAKTLINNFPYIGLFRNQKSVEDGEKLKSALYQVDNEGHFSLNEETYTHFTSPIRRYPDLITHRLIKNVINKEKCSYSEQEIKDNAEVINKNQYIAKQCELKEKNILFNQYLESLTKNKELKSRFEFVSFNESGALLRNKQLIDIFVPYFKLDRKIADYFKENLSEKNPQPILNYVNEFWQTKCYLDRFSWLDEKKDFFVKFYAKELKFTQEDKDKFKMK